MTEKHFVLSLDRHIFDIPYLWEEVKIIALLLHNSNYVNVAFMKYEILKFF